MATSSSDESSSAPKVFHLSSSLDSGSRISSSRPRCRLCWGNKPKYYCKECVLNGLIYHTSRQAAESFLDKKKELLHYEEKKKLCEITCLKHLEDRQKADILESKIRQYRERQRIIKLALEDKKAKRKEYEKKLERLRREVKDTSTKLSKYDEKVAQIEGWAANKYEKVDRQHEELEEKRQEIRKIVKLHIDQLRYIFPIEKVEPKAESTESEVMSALAEASNTLYVRDKWEVAADYSGEMQYSIVKPTLAESGNYSLYNVWVAQNKDAVPVNASADLVDHNPAFNISAALTYTAQLIHVLAFYFDVRLPHRMVYSDFCGSYMNEAQFSRRVMRLNANVLHLCFSQKIDLSALKSSETINNLLKLMDTSNPNLGRQGPIEVDNDTAELLEKSLSRDLDFSGDNTDSDEGDTFHKEWETVPHLPCQEVPMGAPVIQASQVITMQQATSMAGGLMTSAAASIASIWHGFTRQ